MNRVISYSHSRRAACEVWVDSPQCEMVIESVEDGGYLLERCSRGQGGRQAGQGGLSRSYQVKRDHVSCVNDTK